MLKLLVVAALIAVHDDDASIMINGFCQSKADGIHTILGRERALGAQTMCQTICHTLSYTREGHPKRDYPKALLATKSHVNGEYDTSSEAKTTSARKAGYTCLKQQRNEQPFQIPHGHACQMIKRSSFYAAAPVAEKYYAPQWALKVIRENTGIAKDLLAECSLEFEKGLMRQMVIRYLFGQSRDGLSVVHALSSQGE